MRYHFLSISYRQSLRQVARAKVIVQKIRSGQLAAKFTAREIYRKCWTGMTTPADVIEPLRILVDHGYLQAIAAGKTGTGGRGSTIYLAHPSLITKE